MTKQYAPLCSKWKAEAWQLAPVSTIYFLIIPSQSKGTNSSFIRRITQSNRNPVTSCFTEQREGQSILDDAVCETLFVTRQPPVWEKWSLMLPWGPQYKEGKLAFTVRLSALLKHFPPQMTVRHNCTSKMYLTPISQTECLSHTHTFTHPRFEDK